MKRYAVTLPLSLTIEIDAATPDAARQYIEHAFAPRHPYDALSGVLLHDTDNSQIAYLNAKVMVTTLADIDHDDITVDLA